MAELCKWMQFSLRKMLFKFTQLPRFVCSHLLNKDNHFAAIWRVLSWQIISRIMPRSITLPYLNKIYLLKIRGRSGSTGNTIYLRKLNEVECRIPKITKHKLGTREEI